MVTLNVLRYDYKEENPSLWPQSIHEQIKPPESGSEGKTAILEQREKTACLTGQWFSTLVWASESSGEFKEFRFQDHPRPICVLEGGGWENVVSTSAIDD